MSARLAKRVLLTADTVGGVWTYALELTRALQPQGVEVVLAILGVPPSSAQRTAAGAIPLVEAVEHKCKLEWMNDPWEEVDRAGRWLLALEKRFQPDIVHLNSFAFGALPWRAPKLVVGHSCVLSWWRAVRGGDAPADWRHYKHVLQAGLRNAELVVAPSSTMLDALHDHYGPLPETRVIYNGRNSFTQPAALKQPLILSAGRIWDEAKNISALAEIAPRLAWPVAVAGDNTEPGRAPAKSRNDAEVRGLQLLGRLSSEALAAWFERASIFALPARYEPFGLCPLEAALAGCALVLGDIPSLREIWGEAAWFVPPNDLKALEAAVQTLIDRPATRARLAAAARILARSYTADRMAYAYASAYRDLLNHRKPSATAAKVRPVCVS